MPINSISTQSGIDDLTTLLAHYSGVQRVNSSDFAVRFRQVATLRAVSLKVARAPITTGRINGVLGWLSTVGSRMLDGNRLNRFVVKNKLAKSLSRSILREIDYDHFKGFFCSRSWIGTLQKGCGCGLNGIGGLGVDSGGGIRTVTCAPEHFRRRASRDVPYGESASSEW